MKFIELHQSGKKILFNCSNILYVEGKGQTTFLCMGYHDGDPMYEEVDESYMQVITAIAEVK